MTLTLARVLSFALARARVLALALITVRTSFVNAVLSFVLTTLAFLLPLLKLDAHLGLTVVAPLLASLLG